MDCGIMFGVRSDALRCLSSPRESMHYQARLTENQRFEEERRSVCAEQIYNVIHIRRELIEATIGDMTILNESILVLRS